MPFLPLGKLPMSRVPLVEHTWIDLSILELCEACANLQEKELSRLPALDFHDLAWHRFFPRGASWAAPKEADPNVFTEARQRAKANLRLFRGETKEIDARPFLCFDDYAKWERRKIPGDLAQLRREGLVLESWNTWIGNYFCTMPADFHGYLVSPIKHPCPVAEGQDYVVHENTDRVAAALKERNNVHVQLLNLGNSSIFTGTIGNILSPKQREMLEGLQQCPLTRRGEGATLRGDPAANSCRQVDMPLSVPRLCGNLTTESRGTHRGLNRFASMARKALKRTTAKPK
jgi:hypothetical protein